MTFDSAMKAIIRPITIACDDDYYQFIGSGTAFICQYRGQVFVICARHTWENMGITIENFRIFIPGYDWALSFDYEAVVGPEERSDLKVLRVDSQIMGSYPTALMRAFDLNSFVVPAEDFKEGSVFLAVGYPQCRREFHYDKKRFMADLAAFSGPLVGGLTDAVITMRTDFGHVDDIDGLSGSPVFISGDPHLFAGVVIRAGQDAGLIHFIHGACLIHAMDALVVLPPRLMMN
ncbi:hypothetical protein SAMN04490192_2846 [Pseudomonas lundensis]|jgi:hypothetical protein|uniref:hypothetical protein n=1 Tax=Pseudomonas TaxID=286 RepID=UPI0006424AF6|nr:MULTISPECIES: hypothetical protein [Pseudomonas]NNA14000.1 hypothetical protein [Pseudomonas lundensis]NNA27876.1 hypothetical protein [Pseudomonas lundensis]SDQ71409.1 hypothetical protein SAMN04490192_2846 [Pseudomonas lundensis]